MANWTKIGKATGTTWTKITKALNTDHNSTINPGEPIGLLLALTYSDTITFGTSIWTDIPKATGTVWTKVAKAT